MKYSAALIISTLAALALSKPDGPKSETERPKSETERPRTERRSRTDGPGGYGTRTYSRPPRTEGPRTMTEGGDDRQRDGGGDGGGDDGGRRGGDDKGQKAEFRGENAGQNTFKIFAGSKVDGIKEGLDFEFKTTPVPRFSVRLLSESDTAEAQYGVFVGITRLIEFNNTISPFDSHSYVSFKDMRPEDWTPLRDGVETITNGTTILKSVTTSLLFSDDPDYGNLNFTLNALLTSEETTVGSKSVTPSDLKYSIYIKDYNFQYENSNLLLVTALFARNNSAELGSSAGDAIKDKIILGGGDGSLLWDTTYTSGGLTYEIISDSAVSDDVFGDTKDNLNDREKKEGGEKAKIITYEFKGSNDIVWDPQLSLASTALESSNLKQSSAGSKSVGPSFLAFCLTAFAALMM